MDVTPSFRKTVFRPFQKNVHHARGHSVKNECITYVPANADSLITITENEFATVSIEVNALRRILLLEAPYLVKEAREYVLCLESGLNQSMNIDWYACLMQGHNRDVYDELIKDQVIM